MVWRSGEVKEGGRRGQRNETKEKPLTETRIFQGRASPSLSLATTLHIALSSPQQKDPYHLIVLHNNCEEHLVDYQPRKESRTEASPHPQPPPKMSTKVQKAMVAPINLIFRHLQTKQVVEIWLFEQLHTRIEGKIIVWLIRRVEAEGVMILFDVHNDARKCDDASTLTSEPQGLDEFMNLVLDEAAEINTKKKERKELGMQYGVTMIILPHHNALTSMTRTMK